MSSSSLIILLTVVVAFNMADANPYGYPGPGYPAPGYPGGCRGGYNGPVPYGQQPYLPQPPIIIREDDSALEKFLPFLLILLTQ